MAVAGLIGQLLKMAIVKGSKKAPGQKKQSVTSFFKKGVAHPVRKYKKGSSAVKNDGDGNQKMGQRHGRKLKPLKKDQEFKIRNALQPVDCWTSQNMGIIRPAYQTSAVPFASLSQYHAFEVGTVDDVDKIMPLVNSEDGAIQSGNGKLYLKDYSMFLKLVNQENCVVNMRVYEYIARRDLPHGYTSTENILETGFGDEVVSQITGTTVGGTLFNNPLFCAMNKITKVRNVQLAPGKEFVLSLSHLKGRTINPMVWDNTEIETVRGYTRGYVIQLTGQPANGAIATGQQLIPGLTGFKVNWLQINRYHFQTGFNISGKNFLEDNVNAYPDDPLVPNQKYPVPNQFRDQVNNTVTTETQA